MLRDWMGPTAWPRRSDGDPRSHVSSVDGARSGVTVCSPAATASSPRSPTAPMRRLMCRHHGSKRPSCCTRNRRPLPSRGRSSPCRNPRSPPPDPAPRTRPLRALGIWSPPGRARIRQCTISRRNSHRSSHCRHPPARNSLLPTATPSRRDTLAAATGCDAPLLYVP
jgi:hypothetical protein